jgi:hypothetical protein
MMNISNTIKLAVALLVVAAFVVTRLNSPGNVSAWRMDHHPSCRGFFAVFI